MGNTVSARCRLNFSKSLSTSAQPTPHARAGGIGVGHEEIGDGAGYAEQCRSRLAQDLMDETDAKHFASAIRSCERIDRSFWE